MDLLEKEFSYKFFVYSEIIREGNFAIYKFTNPKWDSKKEYFDTIEVKIVPETTYPNGIKVPIHESYPRDREWGICAWTYNTLPEAKKKLNELIEKDKKNT